MNFKTFTIAFWGVTMFLPLILWAIKGWDYQLTWWTVFVATIYVIACIAELISNKKVKK